MACLCCRTAARGGSSGPCSAALQPQRRLLVRRNSTGVPGAMPSRRALAGRAFQLSQAACSEACWCCEGCTGWYRAVRAARAAGRRSSSSSSMHAAQPPSVAATAARLTGCWEQCEQRSRGALAMPRSVCARGVVGGPALGWVCDASASGEIREILRVVLLLTGVTLPLRLPRKSSYQTAAPAHLSIQPETTAPSPFVIPRRLRAASADWERAW
jgi:hypothetical protein